ncbi:uncharacterized protein O3C94_023368 [Discoglossus pictus]
MAVSSLHYTMGISSGFKVYILEGQHSPREPERPRPVSNHRIPVYPIKRKVSPEPPQPLKRVCPVRTMSREKVSSSTMNMEPAARLPPQSTNTPRVLSSHLALERVLKRLIPEQRCPQPDQEDQPLALVKRVEKPCRPSQEMPPTTLQQMRPSVITCVSRQKPTVPPSVERRDSLDSESQGSSRTSSPDVLEEHFQRSLGSCYNHPSIHSPSSDTCSPSRFTCTSVEDHFSKALGAKWLLIRAAADSPSSPESRPRTLLR